MVTECGNYVPGGYPLFQWTGSAWSPVGGNAWQIAWFGRHNDFWITQLAANAPYGSIYELETLGPDAGGGLSWIHRNTSGWFGGAIADQHVVYANGDGGVYQWSDYFGWSQVIGRTPLAAISKIAYDEITGQLYAIDAQDRIYQAY
jgi:hypothetical protein